MKIHEINKMICMIKPIFIKSVNLKPPGPYISMWVLEPMGEAKLIVTEIINEMTKGRGLHPMTIASL